MTRSERLLLLLCSDLGDGALQPLKPAEYRLLRQRLLSLNRPEAELDAALLCALGYDAAQTARIMALLERNPDPWLRLLASSDITPLTRLNPFYPARLREKLGESAPLLLYTCGDQSLLQKAALSVVGSRKAGASALETATAAGRWIAERGYALCSGGAEGVDTAVLEACLNAGGSAILYLPGEILPTARRYQQWCRKQKLLLVSASPMTRFHPARALERNRWIHAHGCAALVCQCEAGKGGSWRGASENLKHSWSPVFVPADDSAGSRDLLARGAQVLDWDAICAVCEAQ